MSFPIVLEGMEVVGSLQFDVEKYQIVVAVVVVDAAGVVDPAASRDQILRLKEEKMLKLLLRLSPLKKPRMLSP